MQNKFTKSYTHVGAPLWNLALGPKVLLAALSLDHGSCTFLLYLAAQLTTVSLDVRHLGCKHGFLSHTVLKIVMPTAFLEQITKYLTRQ